MPRLAALAALALAALAAASCGSGDDGGPGAGASGGGAASAPRHGEARIRGTVVENDLGCRLGRRCALRLRDERDDGEIVVVYHWGESPPCRNAEAADAGQAVAVGARVEVTGRWQRTGREVVLSTCDSPAYAIRVL